MAKIGVKHFLLGMLAEAADGTATYGAPIKPGKAVSASVNITSNSAELYADDALAESDYSFQSGDITLGIDNDDIETLGFVLGHTVNDGEMVSNSNDIAPYLGVGRIVTKIVGGVKKYRVMFLNKVKFSEPSESDSTKGESVTFGTHELGGRIHTLANGDWRKSKEFTSEDAAAAYLEGLFGQIYTMQGFTGDGTTSVFTLDHAPASITAVYFNGNKVSGYTYSGTTLTFGSAPPENVNIVVSYAYASGN